MARGSTYPTNFWGNFYDLLEGVPVICGQRKEDQPYVVRRKEIYKTAASENAGGGMHGERGAKTGWGSCHWVLSRYSWNSEFVCVSNERVDSTGSTAKYRYFTKICYLDFSTQQKGEKGNQGTLLNCGGETTHISLLVRVVKMHVIVSVLSNSRAIGYIKPAAWLYETRQILELTPCWCWQILL